MRQWMQETLYETADAGDILSDRGCRSPSILHRMKDSLLQTADAPVTLPAMTVTDTFSDSGCKSLSIRQRCWILSIRQLTQGSLYWTADARIYQTANAEPFLGDSGCRRHSIKPINAGISLSDSRCSGCRTLSYSQRMQETLYETVDAEVLLSDSGCRTLSNSQLVQETLYETVNAEVSLSDSGCRTLSIG